MLRVLHPVHHTSIRYIIIRKLNKPKNDFIYSFISYLAKMSIVFYMTILYTILYYIKIWKGIEIMICPKCENQNVTVQTNTYIKSKSRSFLWNLIMITCTCGFWLLWMLIRRRKEVTATETIATCQGCGYSWKIR